MHPNSPSTPHGKPPCTPPATKGRADAVAAPVRSGDAGVHLIGHNQLSRLNGQVLRIERIQRVMRVTFPSTVGVEADVLARYAFDCAAKAKASREAAADPACTIREEKLEDARFYESLVRSLGDRLIQIGHQSSKTAGGC